MLLRLKRYRFVLKLTAYLLPLFGFYVGLKLWLFSWAHIGRTTQFAAHSYTGVLFLSCFVWAFLAEHYRVTSVDELFRERTGIRTVCSACAATSVVLLAILYFSRQYNFPRGLFLFCMFALLVLAVLMRAVFRFLCRRRLGATRPTRLLVVGADNFAWDASQRLQRLSFAPCRVVAFIHLPGQVVAVGDSLVYEWDQIGALNADDGIDEAVIAIPPEQFSLIPSILGALNKLCLPTRAVVDLGEGIVARDRLFQLGRMQMLDLTTTPADSLDYVLLKRAFDICFSSAVLILTSPLLFFIAFLIRISSRGPAFFKQSRVGLNGRPFVMYKFRTMRLAPVSESDTRWTTENDSRRTRIGSLLRRTSLDELPQFLNVLKGEMSVVGPRPERPHFVHKFLNEIGRYNQRHCLKVGITGWAQVNGLRGDTSIEKRTQYDLYYLQNWTFGLDLRIILMTLLAGLINRNAY